MVGFCEAETEIRYGEWFRYVSLGKGYIMGWLNIVKQVIDMLSPEIRKEITAALDKMQEKVKATKLPFDDLALMIFRGLTGL